MLFARDSSHGQRHPQAESKKMEKYAMQIESKKIAGIAFLISDKADFKQLFRRDKEDHYVLVRGKIQLENKKTSKYICSQNQYNNYIKKRFLI